MMQKEISVIKPSLLEEVVYVDEADITTIPFGYTKTQIDVLDSVVLKTDKRINLEDDATKRQLVTYVILKYGHKYFLIDRLKGGTEKRLHGLKGCLGGHIDKADMDKFGKEHLEFIKGGLLRELSEEVGISISDIESIHYKGMLKIGEIGDVEKVHLGLVHIIDVKSDKVDSNEIDVLKGEWYTKNDLKSTDFIANCERWLRLVLLEEVL